MTVRCKAAATPAERQRRRRERIRQQRVQQDLQQDQRPRDQQAPIYETAGWQLFTDWDTLGQAANCEPKHLRALVIKEAVDNALDTGATATLTHDGKTWVIADNGPGLDPADVPRLFAVNRPLLSSKLVRRPLRGMLGNGLRVVAGAVAAKNGTLAVESRGRRLTLAVCHETGRTNVVTDEPVEKRRGLVVRLSLGQDRHSDRDLADDAIAAAKHGKPYTGPSSPWWYGAKDLHHLFARVTPADSTVGDVYRSLGLEFDDHRPARSLSRADAEAVLTNLRLGSPPVPPKHLGAIGEDCWPDLLSYGSQVGTTTDSSGAVLPFIVEAWAACSHSTRKGSGSVRINLLLNRSRTVAEISCYSVPDGIHITGCGLRRYVSGPPTGDYTIKLSLITPHVGLTSNGKAPDLSPFSEALAKALGKACGAAHRAMDRPKESGVTIKAAAYSVMAKAYRIASDNGRLPANARQIMYAARPFILQATRTDRLNDKRFTQELLPD